MLTCSSKEKKQFKQKISRQNFKQLLCRTWCSPHLLHEEQGQLVQKQFHYHIELYPGKKKHCTEKRLEKNSNKYFFRSEFIVVCYSCEKELLKTSSCMSARCFPPFCSTKRLRVLLKQLQLMMVHQKLHPQYYIMSPQCTRSSRHQRILQISHGILLLNFADMNHF